MSTRPPNAKRIARFIGGVHLDLAMTLEEAERAESALNNLSTSDRDSNFYRPLIEIHRALRYAVGVARDK